MLGAKICCRLPGLGLSSRDFECMCGRCGGEGPRGPSKAMSSTSNRGRLEEEQKKKLGRKAAGIKLGGSVGIDWLLYLINQAFKAIGNNSNGQQDEVGWGCWTDRGVLLHVGCWDDS